MADHNNPQSRTEEILIATIDGEEYDKNPQSRMEELLLELKETIEEGGGGGGTTNYENLSNQPQVNGETLIGDKSGADLGLVDAEEGKGLSTNDYDDTEKASVAAATSAITAMKDGSELDSFGDVEVALLDKADISDLGTAAAKDSTNAVTSGSTDLVESGAVKDAIDAAVSSAYHHAGTKTVAQLTHDLLIAANEGNVYNITDSGTTTSDFIEGIGKTIDEGSNVGICKVGNVYMFDLLSGFVDTTNLVQKSETAGLLKNDGTVDTTIEDDVDSLKSGLTSLDTEVNGDATVYPYADVITIEDAVPANVADCTVKIEPDQDLHGFDHPWVGGAGKNKQKLEFSNDVNVIGGLAFSHTDDTFTLVGTQSSSDTTYRVLYDAIVPNLAVGNNTLSINVNGTYVRCVVTVKFFDASNNVLAGASAGVENGATEAQDTFEMPSGTVDHAQFIIEGLRAGEYNATFKVQLEQGSTATAWSPYTNYCPITRHTEASVQRDGKNLFDKSAAGIVIGKYLNSETGELVNSTNNWNTSDYIYVGGLSGESITFSGLNSIGTSNFSVCYYDKNNSFISGSNGKVMTLAIPSDERIAYLRFDYRQVDADDVQLELDSTATPYEPYQGKTYTIALGDAIYGVTVDFNTGVMTVDRKYYTIGSIDDFNNNGGAVFPSSAWIANETLSDGKTGGLIISDRYNQIEGSPQIGVYISASGKIRINTNGAYESKQDAFDNELKDTQFVYELATPFTVQLTPTQIQLLKGTNTLTASTGQISVTVNGVSGAIGSLTADKQDKTDYALETTAKTVVGGINELKNRVKVIEVTTSDTVDQGTTVKVPSGYDAAKAVIVGYTAQRTNNIWYNTDDHVEVGMYADYLYVVPKNADVLERTVKVILIKFSA